MFPEQRQNLVFLRPNTGASSQVFQIAHRISHPPLFSFNPRHRLVMPADTTGASVLIPAKRPRASKSRLLRSPSRNLRSMLARSLPSKALVFHLQHAPLVHSRSCAFDRCIDSTLRTVFAHEQRMPLHHVTPTDRNHPKPATFVGHAMKSIDTAGLHISFVALQFQGERNIRFRQALISITAASAQSFKPDLKRQNLCVQAATLRFLPLRYALQPRFAPSRSGLSRLRRIRGGNICRIRRARWCRRLQFSTPQHLDLHAVRLRLQDAHGQPANRR
jgi:hypothetical protein